MFGLLPPKPTSLDLWLRHRISEAEWAAQTRTSAGHAVAVGAVVAAGGVALAVTLNVAWLALAAGGALLAVWQRGDLKAPPAHVQARRAQAHLVAQHVLALKKSEWRFEAMDARAVDLLEAAAERWRHLTDTLKSPVWTHGDAADATADLRRAASEALGALMDDALVLAARCIGRETRRFKIPLLSRGFHHPQFDAIEPQLREAVDSLGQLAAEVDAAVTAVAQTGAPRVSAGDLEALVDRLRSHSAAARELRGLEAGERGRVG